MEVFHFQAKFNEVYKQYLSLLKINSSSINKVNQIPFLPITFFKQFKVVTGEFSPALTFTSSGTTGMVNSNHYVKHEQLYIHSFLNCFRTFYGNESNFTFICLLPSYLEREGSSLIYMMDYLIKSSKNEFSGFYPTINNSFLDLIKQLQNDKKQQVFFIGVTFALLELAEKYPCDLSNFIVLETGGMKGRRKEITRAELYDILRKNLNAKSIHSEYGMTELLSQAYAKENGQFYCPKHMKVLIRDLNDPFTFLNTNQSGVINIIDLANIYSCAFIATEDAGKINYNGSFEVLGRVDHSDVRGCNLLMS
ncbi:MAG TPA: acyl transferase [Bacteroidia bacterium]|nr:acyl transferase [Bacteroidia bacterium]